MDAELEELRHELNLYKIKERANDKQRERRMRKKKEFMLDLPCNIACFAILCVVMVAIWGSFSCILVNWEADGIKDTVQLDVYGFEVNGNTVYVRYISESNEIGVCSFSLNWDSVHLILITNETGHFNVTKSVRYHDAWYLFPFFYYQNDLSDDDKYQYEVYMSEDVFEGYFG